MEVSHRSAACDHAATRVVADVAADDVRLVQIDLVVKHTRAAVVIQMAVTDDDIAISHAEPHAVPRLMHGHANDGELHRARGLDAVCLGMRTGDFDAIHHRRALPGKDFRFQARGIGRASMRAFEMKCRTRALHDETGHPIAAEGDEARFVEIDHDRLRQPIRPSAKTHRATRIDHRLHRRGVVCLAIADRLGVQRESQSRQREEKEARDHGMTSYADKTCYRAKQSSRQCAVDDIGWSLGFSRRFGIMKPPIIG